MKNCCHVPRLICILAYLGCGLAIPVHAAEPTPTPSPNFDHTGEFTGKVVETMNAGRYTYVRVENGTNTVWAAAPEFPVKVGDEVMVPKGIPMKDFKSKELDRVFPDIAFVGGVRVNGEFPKALLPPDQPGFIRKPKGQAEAQPQRDLSLSGIKPAKGGQTVADLFANAKTLSGKTVLVRGKVVKFTSRIMNRNWIHLQDGTGAAGSNDLVVTTADTVAVGDVILIKGTVRTDIDFGFGYKYDVLVVEAKVQVV